MHNGIVEIMKTLKTSQLARLISEIIGKYTKGKELKYPSKPSKNHSTSTVIIKSNGDINISCNKLNITQAIGNVSEFTNIPSSKRAQILDERINSFNFDETYTHEDSLVAATGIDGKVRYFDTLTKQIIKIAPRQNSDANLLNYYDSEILAQFSAINPKFRKFSDDILQAFDDIACNRDAPINYQYFKESQIILVQNKPATRDEQVTLYRKQLKAAPQVNVYHHFHKRSLGDNLSEYFAIVNDGAEQLINSVKTLFSQNTKLLNDFSHKIENTKGTMHFIWDGHYNYSSANFSSVFEQETLYLKRAQHEQLQRYLDEQGNFLRSVWVVSNFKNEYLDIDYSLDDYNRVRSLQSFEGKKLGNIKTLDHGVKTFRNIIFKPNDETNFKLLGIKTKFTAELSVLGESLIKDILANKSKTKKLPKVNWDNYSNSPGDDFELAAAKALEKIREEALREYAKQNSYRFNELCEKFLSILLDIIHLYLTTHGTHRQKISDEFFSSKDNFLLLIKILFLDN